MRSRLTASRKCDEPIWEPEPLGEFPETDARGDELVAGRARVDQG